MPRSWELKIPSWAETDHPFVGRHVTCGEIHYRIIAVEPARPSEVLVTLDGRDDTCMWISLDHPTNWRFVNLLDEIAKAIR